MQYRRLGKTGFDISALGFGCMRFPMKDSSFSGKDVDDDEVVKMIRSAIDNGVNYLDTAYVYHNGRSESVVGKAIKKGYRNKVKLATKCPVWMMKDNDDFDRILDEQLKRLGVDHIDFYLMHALNGAMWENMKKFGLMAKAEKALKDGKIGHIGFSFHDEQKAFFRIIDDYDKWEFCQIQLNYLNETEQAGLDGLFYAAEKGLGVIVMEPLLGGKLAKPKTSIMDVFHETDPSRDACEWAFSYLWDMPQVSAVLSGMSSMEQVKQNLSYADKAAPGMFTAKEKAAIQAVQKKFKEMGGVPCTKCGYCMPCPVGVDIPRNFEIYNELFQHDAPHMTKRAYAELKWVHKGLKTANNCIKCGACEAQCPQHIQISQLMEKVHAELA